MQTVTTIGLDIAKSVFQIHGIDAAGNVIVRRKLKRRYVLPFFQKLPPCLVGIEACASSHHWSRELQSFGHAVRRECRSPDISWIMTLLTGASLYGEEDQACSKAPSQAPEASG